MIDDEIDHRVPLPAHRVRVDRQGVVINAHRTQRIVGGALGPVSLPSTERYWTVVDEGSIPNEDRQRAQHCWAR